MKIVGKVSKIVDVTSNRTVEFQYDNEFMSDDVSIPLSKENDSSMKIKNNGLIEFYVIGKDFSWCYIVTHERDGCGPYFIINKNNK